MEANNALLTVNQMIKKVYLSKHRVGFTIINDTFRYFVRYVRCEWYLTRHHTSLVRKEDKMSHGNN